MKFLLQKVLFLLLPGVLLFSCHPSSPKNDQAPPSASTDSAKSSPLAKASRQNNNGWIYVHLEGSPSDIGYQHGYLLSDEIDTTIQALSYFLAHETKKDWAFYRQCAHNFLWDKLDREYKDEIIGIASGLHAKQKNYDSLDITALNAMEELAFYYVPQLMDKEKSGSGNNKAPG